MPIQKTDKTKKKPLKILLYGDSGVGKTHFALHATPPNTLVFDLEGGTDLFEGRVDFYYWTDENGYKTQSYKELRKCIDFLKTEEGRKFETFVIDPATVIWNMLQQERQDYKEERATRQKTNETDLENFTTRDWNIIKKMYKGVLDELMALPQNVILIAREKQVVEMRNGEPVFTGEYTYDCEKSTKYFADFVIRLFIDKKTGKRYAMIEKDRSGYYKTGDTIENPTFAMFDAIVNKLQSGDEYKPIKTENKNVFIEDEELKSLIDEMTTILKQLGNDEEKRNQFANIVRKYHKGANYLNIQDTQIAKKIVEELRKTFNTTI